MENSENNQIAPWLVLAFFVGTVGAFELSGYVLPALFPHIAAGVLFASRAMISMAVAFIISLLDPRTRRRWHNAESGGLLVRVGTTVLFLVAMASWSATAIVEGDGLSQPDHSVGIYTVPVNLKGQTRYLTPLQAEIDKISVGVFFGCAVAGMAAGFYLRRARNKT